MSVFHTETQGGTLVVTLDRPPLNALSAETLEEGHSTADGHRRSTARSRNGADGCQRRFLRPA